MADILSQSQIDALLNNLNSGEVDIEKIESETDNSKIKNYDFSSPKKVTRENIKILNGIYESYGRIVSSYLSAVLRLFCEIEVEQIEESVFYEYNNALSDSVLLCVVDFLLPDSGDVCGQVLVNFSKPLAFSIIDKLMGGDGSDYNYDRDFTDVEISILNKLFKEVISKMQDAWQSTVPIGIELNKVETNARFIQSIGYNDAVLLIVMNTVVKGLNGTITVCIPTLTLNEVFKKSELLLKFKRKKSDQQKIENDKKLIMKYLKKSNLNVIGELGKVDLSLQEVLKIQTGDVIVLGNRIDEDVNIKVGEKVWFKGKWGVKKNRNSIKINEILY